MNDRPHAHELLSIACDTFTAEILPALAGPLRYTGLMIANAMGIARREIEASEAAIRAEMARLQALFAETGDRPGFSDPSSETQPKEAESRSAEKTASVPAKLASYNRRLAQEIRAGRFDGEERGALLDHLRRTTEEKLAVSNPKMLDRK